MAAQPKRHRATSCVPGSEGRRNAAAGRARPRRKSEVAPPSSAVRRSRRSSSVRAAGRLPREMWREHSTWLRVRLRLRVRARARARAS